MKHNLDWFDPNENTSYQMRDYTNNWPDRLAASAVMTGIALLVTFIACVAMALAGVPAVQPGPVFMPFALIAFPLTWFATGILQKTHKYYGLSRVQREAVDAYDALPESAKNEIPNMWVEVKTLGDPYDDRVELERITRKMQDVRNKYDKLQRLENRNPTALGLFKEGLTRAESELNLRDEALREMDEMA